MRLVLAATLALSLTTMREAKACHSGHAIVLALFTVGSVITDVPLTIHDIAVFDSSFRYGVIETAITVPTTAISLAFVVSGSGTCDEGGTDYPIATRKEQGTAAVLLGWNGLLLAHGIYTLVRPRAAPTPSASLGVVPLVDGEVTGVQIVGMF